MDKPVPISLALGSMQFSMANGKWTAITPLEEGEKADPEEVASLKSEVAHLTERLEAMAEQKQLEEFKSKLLTEMVRVLCT